MIASGSATNQRRLQLPDIATDHSRARRPRYGGLGLRVRVGVFAEPRDGPGVGVYLSLSAARSRWSGRGIIHAVMTTLTPVDVRRVGQFQRSLHGEGSVERCWALVVE